MLWARAVKRTRHIHMSIRLRTSAMVPVHASIQQGLPTDSCAGCDSSTIFTKLRRLAFMVW